MSGSDNDKRRVVLTSRTNTGIQVTLVGVADTNALAVLARDDSTATLTAEATRYLEAIDLVRTLDLDIKWRSEADEVGVLSPLPEQRRPPTCKCCAGPLVWMNGIRVCFRTLTNARGSTRCQS
jgi:hypothetical protein